jgi:hypothetical protein
MTISTSSDIKELSGSDNTPIPHEDILPKGEILTSAAISDMLFIEICSGPNANWYYAEAATYARRASAGNFDGKNAKYKPVFRLDSKHFSHELRANLAERRKTSIESLHRVVEDAVFRIFRARHKMIFYQNIEAEGLRWVFV